MYLSMLGGLLYEAKTFFYFHYYVRILITFSVTVLGGGCGSSTHNISQTPNEIFSGTWSMTSGTAQITMNGETDNLTFKDFDFNFSSCDLESTDGTAILSSFTIMKGSKSGYISAFLDNENIITERSGDLWTFTMEGAKTLSMELLSETEANITGVIDNVIDPNGDPIACNVNILMKKDTASTPALDVDGILPGLWQTVDSNGKYSESGGTMIIQGEVHSFNDVFSLLLFASVDIEGGTTDSIMQTMAKFSGDKMSTRILLGFPTTSKFSRMFANIYKFEHTIDKDQLEFYAVKINDENTASLIMHEIDQSPNESEDAFQFEGHAVMSLHKKPDNMTVNLNDMAGSVWSAQDGNAALVTYTAPLSYENTVSSHIDEIEAGSLKLTINSADISDNSLNAVLTGTLNSAEGTYDINNIPMKFQWLKYYNVWYENSHHVVNGKRYYVYSTLSLLTEDSAVLIALLMEDEDTTEKQYYIHIGSTLKKENQ